MGKINRILLGIILSFVFVLVLSLAVAGEEDIIYDPEGYIGAKFVMELHELPEGAITRPMDVVTDCQGRILVVDNLDRVLIFDSEGNFLKSFGERGKREGQFRDPSAIAVDDRCRIFVADSGNNRVQVFDSEGNYLYEFGEKPPRRGEPGPGQLARPIAMTVHDGLVYVVDIDAHRVHVFTVEGEFQRAFGRLGTGDGELNYPVGIGFDQEDYLYIVNALNFRIEVFAPDGEWEYNFGKAGDTVGCFSRPKTIASDSSGNLYVTDSLLNLIQILDYEGEYLGRIGGQSETPLFAQPFGIWIDPNDRLYVADRGNDRIMVFDLFELE